MARPAVNGEMRELDASRDGPLLRVLRVEADFTGAKFVPPGGVDVAANNVFIAVTGAEIWRWYVVAEPDDAGSETRNCDQGPNDKCCKRPGDPILRPGVQCADPGHRHAGAGV